MSGVEGPDDPAASTLIARLESIPFSRWHLRARIVVGSATFFDAFDALSLAFVLPALVPQAESLCVPAGALDNDPGARARYHIFCGEQEKALWFEITDDLPQFARYAPLGFNWRQPHALEQET